MIGNVLEHLLSVEPRMVGGRFFTESSDGRPGESGEFCFESGRRWVVALTGGPTLANTESGSLVAQGRQRDYGPPHGRLHRPPWSFLSPRYSLLWGRDDDDWRVDAVTALEDEAVEVTFSRRDGRPAKAAATIDMRMAAIVDLRLPSRHEWMHVAPLGAAGQRLRDRLEILREVPPWGP